MTEKERAEAAEKAKALKAKSGEAAPAIEEPDDFSTELTDEDIADIKAQARKSVAADVRKKKIKEFLEAEKQRLREEIGDHDNPHLAGALAEIVDITISIPLWVPFLQVNMPFGKRFYDGQTYPVPRHIANSLNEMMQRCLDHDTELAGKGKVHARPRNTRISAKTLAVTQAA